jgi:hypothetical protein
VKRSFIERYFRELDRQWGRPAEIILTGAAAGALLGHVRPSLDIDFEIRTAKERDASVDEALRRVSEKTGITVNYSEDNSHWSMIDLLDYRNTAFPYKTIGKLRIKLMAPEYWTLGKMGRFIEPDIRDLIKIIRKRKLPAERLIRLWGRALRSSPLSLASGQFRDHVTVFLEHYGKSVWGKPFDSKQGVVLFKRIAWIR